MRKVILLILLVYTANFSFAQSGNVSIHLQKKSIIEFFKQIEQQTNYSFVYNNEIVADTLLVSVSASSENLNKVLDRVLLDKKLSYKLFSERIIVVSKAGRFKNEDKSNISLSGKIRDKKNKDLSLATVVLLENETELGVTLSNELGEFNFSYPMDSEKSYRLKISSVGYNNLTVDLKNTDIKDSKNNLGKLVLETKTNQLAEVVVVADQPAITVEGGNIIFNVANNITAQGSNALEVVGKAPGVTVGSDNNIMLNGKSGVMILLDGKQTYLSNKEIADLLKSLSSSNIKSIEIINAPGAKYDASGTAGIINVRTSKILTKGLNGNITTGLNYGVSLKNSQDLSISLRNNKLNLYGNYGHLIGNYSYLYGTDRLQAGNFYNSFTDDTDKRNKVNSRFGLDYYINKNNTFGALVTGNFIFGGGITDTKTDIGLADNSRINETLYAINDYYFQKTQRYNFNLNYKYEDSLGTIISVDADYGTFDKGNGNMQSNKYVSSDNTVLSDNLYRSLNNIDVNLKALKFDYTTTLWKGKLESGLKFSSVKTDNDTRFLKVLTDGEFIDSTRTNHFIYDEKILAGYVNYKKEIKKWSYQMGLRIENTQSNGQLQNTQFQQNNIESNAKNYTNLFPFFALSVNPSKSNNISLSYNRRIDRPAYQSLNPFIYLLDELSYWRGNPFLKPQLSHKLLLQYVYKSKTIMGLSYTHTSDFSVEITDTVDKVKIMMTPRNLGIQQHIAFNFVQSFDPYKWWKMSFNGNVYRIHNKISFSEQRDLDLKQTAFRVNLIQTYKLPLKITAELSNYYNSRRLIGANKIVQGNSVMDVGFQRNFFGNKGSLRLGVSDVYKGGRSRSVQEVEGLYLLSYGYFESRQFKINFSYKFSSGSNKGPRERRSALDAENDRIK